MSDIKKLLQQIDTISTTPLMEDSKLPKKFPGYLKGTDSAKEVKNKMVGMEEDAATAVSGIAGKAASKLLPGVGTALSYADAWDRYKKGDKVGAALAGAAGTAALIPGPGTMISGALDAANIGRDIKRGEYDDFVKDIKNIRETDPVDEGSLKNYWNLGKEFLGKLKPGSTGGIPPRAGAATAARVDPPMYGVPAVRQPTAVATRPNAVGRARDPNIVDIDAREIKPMSNTGRAAIGATTAGLAGGAAYLAEPSKDRQSGTSPATAGAAAAAPAAAASSAPAATSSASAPRPAASSAPAATSSASAPAAPSAASAQSSSAETSPSSRPGSRPGTMPPVGTDFYYVPGGNITDTGDETERLARRTPASASSASQTSEPEPSMPTAQSTEQDTAARGSGLRVPDKFSIPTRDFDTGGSAIDSDFVNRTTPNVSPERIQAPAAAPAAAPQGFKFTPEQEAWLGNANRQDPFIINRMLNKVGGPRPPASFFSNAEDQNTAQRLGFKNPAPASSVREASQIKKKKIQSMAENKHKVANRLARQFENYLNNRFDMVESNYVPKKKKLR